MKSHLQVLLVTLVLSSFSLARGESAHSFEPFLGDYKISSCWVLAGLPETCHSAQWGYESFHVAKTEEGYALVLENAGNKKLIPLLPDHREINGELAVEYKNGVEQDGTVYMMKLTSKRPTEGTQESDLEVYKIKKLSSNEARFYFVKSVSMNGLEVVETTLQLDLTKTR